jgi:hypothetical protein
MTRRSRLGARLAAVGLAAILSFGLAAVALASNAVRISQVYGGNGVAGSFNQDYVELFNSGATDVDISGWAVEYSSSASTAVWGGTGSTWQTFFVFPANTKIKACGYLLVGGASSGGGTALSPVPDYVVAGPGYMNRAAGAGRVGLFNTLFVGAICTTEGSALVDKVAYGNSVCAEGVAGAPTLTNILAAFRGGAGMTDTDVNSADFTTGTPAPRNSSSLRCEPTSQATGLIFNPVGAASMTLNWTNGSGMSRLVVMKQASAVASVPVDGTGYTANPAYGSGGQLSDGSYVVASGAENSATVSGLSQGTTYHVAIFEFNGSTGTANYRTTSPLTGSQMTASGCPTITLSPASLPGGSLVAGYSQEFSATGGTAPYTFSKYSGDLPPGLTLSGTTLSGTPTAAGDYGFTIQAVDTYGCPGTLAYSVTIASCAAIVLTPASLPAAPLDVPYSQDIAASGGASGYTFTVASGALPTGLALATDGTLSGTPTAQGNYALYGDGHRRKHVHRQPRIQHPRLRGHRALALVAARWGGGHGVQRGALRRRWRGWLRLCGDRGHTAHGAVARI